MKKQYHVNPLLASVLYLATRDSPLDVRNRIIASSRSPVPDRENPVFAEMVVNVKPSAAIEAHLKQCMRYLVEGNDLAMNPEWPLIFDISAISPGILNNESITAINKAKADGRQAWVFCKHGQMPPPDSEVWHRLLQIGASFCHYGASPKLLWEEAEPCFRVWFQYHGWNQWVYPWSDVATVQYANICKVKTNNQYSVASWEDVASKVLSRLDAILGGQSSARALLLAMNDHRTPD